MKKKEEEEENVINVQNISSAYNKNKRNFLEILETRKSSSYRTIKNSAFQYSLFFCSTLK